VQGREPVRAAILQGGNLAVRFSIKDDRLLQDGAAKQLTVCEMSDHAATLPRMSQIGPTYHFLLAVQKLGIKAHHRVLSILTRPIIYRDVLTGQAASVLRLRSFCPGPAADEPECAVDRVIKSERIAAS